jgi:hypothetical protein
MALPAMHSSVGKNKCFWLKPTSVCVTLKSETKEDQKWALRDIGGGGVVGEGKPTSLGLILKSEIVACQKLSL